MLTIIMHKPKPFSEWSSDRGRYFIKAILQTKLTRVNGCQISKYIYSSPRYLLYRSSAAMEEMLIHTENIDKAIAEVEAAGGHVLLQLGQNLLVAKVPSHACSQAE